MATSGPRRGAQPRRAHVLEGLHVVAVAWSGRTCRGRRPAAARSTKPVICPPVQVEDREPDLRTHVLEEPVALGEERGGAVSVRLDAGSCRRPSLSKSSHGRRGALGSAERVDLRVRDPAADRLVETGRCDSRRTGWADRWCRVSCPRARPDPGRRRCRSPPRPARADRPGCADDHARGDVLELATGQVRYSDCSQTMWLPA
jgi:hypothetical protein